MELILVLIGAIGIGLSMLLQKRVVEKIQEKRRYNLYLASDILLYVSEICAMFGIFLLATDNFIHTTQYRVEEDSLLKIFIDFFVVYQITLLILFKLMDSHFINACQMMLRSINIARNIVQNRESVERFLEIYDGNETVYSFTFPPEVMYMYRDTMEDMEMYEKRYQMNSLDDTVLNHYLRMLDSNESFIARLVEIRQDEWGVSIMKRIKKRKSMKHYRKRYLDSIPS